MLLVCCVVNFFGRGRVRSLLLLLGHLFLTQGILDNLLYCGITISFGPSFFTQGILDNLLYCGVYLFHDTCSIMVCLGFTDSLAPARVTVSWLVVLSSIVERPTSIFSFQGTEVFLPVWGGGASV
jgi:hypothetical protein